MSRPVKKQSAVEQPSAKPFIAKPSSAKLAVKKPLKAKAVRLVSKEVLAEQLQILDELYPNAECELTWRNPLELMVAVQLSAQCTDKRVNLVTPALFARFPTVEAFATADYEELCELVRTTGFYRNKAKNIQAACQKIITDFHGKVPRTMEELLTLPGVARKTANVVLGVAFDTADGVVVDTHIWRLSRRLGMTQSDNPIDIEKDLMRRWPQERWVKSAHQLIWHGRRVCAALRPACGECRLNKLCPSAGVGC